MSYIYDVDVEKSNLKIANLVQKEFWQASQKIFVLFSQGLALALSPYSKALCNIFDGEQALNVLFNLIELQKVDPICRNMCPPSPQLSFDEY